MTFKNTPTVCDLSGSRHANREINYIKALYRAKQFSHIRVTDLWNYTNTHKVKLSLNLSKIFQPWLRAQVKGKNEKERGRAWMFRQSYPFKSMKAAFPFHPSHCGDPVSTNGDTMEAVTPPNTSIKLCSRLNQVNNKILKFYNIL